MAYVLVMCLLNVHVEYGVRLACAAAGAGGEDLHWVGNNLLQQSMWKHKDSI
jgi:hypothetical protein